MTGRTRFDALENYARPITAALLCVTESRLTYNFPRTDSASVVSFKNDHTVIRRERGVSNLLLSVRQGYRVDLLQHDAEEPYRVATTSWHYTILDNQERELLAYHWHPDGVSDNKAPHFHVGSAIIDTTGHEMGKTFSRLHLPSGQVTIAEVIRALIEGFGVQPVHSRWDTTLHACQEIFEQQRANP